MTESYGYLFGIIAFILIIAFAWSILSLIGNWMLFKKAGEDGWKSIIPFYSQVVSCKLFMGKAELAIIPIAASLVSSACSKSEDLVFISILAWLVSLVFSIFQSIDIAKSFGKSSAFTVGLIFLPFIFLLILGLGNDQYYGPKGVSDYMDNNYYNGGYGRVPYAGANRYQNNGYNNFQNNGYQNNGYNNNYQNNGYQNNGYNNNYQNNGYQNNGYNNNYQNNGYDNSYQNQNQSYNNPNANNYQNPGNGYNVNNYNSPNNNGYMDDIDTSNIDMNNTDL